MGLILPDPDSPQEKARVLITQKESIEAEIETHLSILRANNSTLRSPLIDADGFPRADIDIYAVRQARVRVIELRNDLDAAMNAIQKALEVVFDPKHAAASSASEPPTTVATTPFAKVDGVAPGSPAADAGLQREDLVVKFGTLTHESFTSTSLQPLADLVAANENSTISIKVLRSDRPVFLSLTPRKGWGGRGMLGCHLVPYSSS